MIKNDYGHLNTPFYQQKENTGVNLIFIPKKSEEKSGVLYIPQGFYLHDNEINKTKINFGCPFLLQEMILDEKTREEINKEGKIESETTFSYTIYKITTKGDLIKLFNILLERIRNLSLTDEIVESYKKKLILEYKEDPLSISKEKTIENMFFSSPMTNGTHCKGKDINKIHLTEMKKFLFRYYSLKSLTFIASYDADPSSFLEDCKKIHFPIFPETKSVEKKFEENYSEVKEKRDIIICRDSLDNILTFGIKLDERKNLFEKFGELIFIFYEIVLDYLKEDEEFKKMLSDTNSSLLSMDLKEGYEDTFILMSFKCEKFSTLSNALSNHLSSIIKKKNRKYFKMIKENYMKKAEEILSDPDRLVYEFARVYADNLPYTYVVDKVRKFSYSDFLRILETILSYPRCVTYMKKEEE